MSEPGVNIVREDHPSPYQTEPNANQTEHCAQEDVRRFAVTLILPAPDKLQKTALPHFPILLKSLKDYHHEDTKDMKKK